MKIAYKDKLDKRILPGRVISDVAGKLGPIPSTRMTMGYAYYSAESGPMEPHQHAEEICVCTKSQGGFFRYGDSKDNLGERIDMVPGMIIHFDPLEWHVFDYDEGGHVEIIFFYGQTENIRPEDILKNNK